MFDGGESSPLVGQEMTTLSDTTVMPVLSSGKKLNTFSWENLALGKYFKGGLLGHYTVRSSYKFFSLKLI